MQMHMRMMVVNTTARHVLQATSPLIFTQVIIRKWNTDRQMDGHTDIQHETIIPHYYPVAGYKKH